SGSIGASLSRIWTCPGLSGETSQAACRFSASSAINPPVTTEFAINSDAAYQPLIFQWLSGQIGKPVGVVVQSLFELGPRCPGGQDELGRRRQCNAPPRARCDVR